MAGSEDSAAVSAAADSAGVGGTGCSEGRRAEGESGDTWMVDPEADLMDCSDSDACERAEVVGVVSVGDSDEDDCVGGIANDDETDVCAEPDD